MTWGAAILNTAGFLSDLVTVVLGALTLYGLIKYKDKVSNFLRVIKLHHLNDRKVEIEKTLDAIRSSAQDRKSIPEVRALFGDLNGQLMGLVKAFPEFESVQLQVAEVAHKKAKLTEPLKMQLTSEIAAQFENCKLLDFKQSEGRPDE